MSIEWQFVCSLNEKNEIIPCRDEVPEIEVLFYLVSVRSYLVRFVRFFCSGKDGSAPLLEKFAHAPMERRLLRLCVAYSCAAGEFVHLCGTLYLQISDSSLTLQLFLNANLKFICIALFYWVIFSFKCDYCKRYCRHNRSLYVKADEKNVLIRQLFKGSY